MKRLILTAALLTALATALQLSPAALAGPAEPAQREGTHLSAAAAKRMMRTVLGREFGRRWTASRDHRLDCSTAVHPERGGAAQESEIRRRCYFSWTFREVRYHGHGLIWLSGRNPEGERHWVFQMTVYERRGDDTDVFRQSGSVRSP